MRTVQVPDVVLGVLCSPALHHFGSRWFLMFFWGFRLVSACSTPCFTPRIAESSLQAGPPLPAGRRVRAAGAAAPSPRTCVAGRKEEGWFLGGWDGGGWFWGKNALFFGRLFIVQRCLKVCDAEDIFSSE